MIEITSGLRLRFDRVLLPGALGRFGHEALFEGAGGDADVADFTVDQRLYALQIRHKFTLGDGGDVRADTAAFLGFTTAPDDAALARADSG